MTLSLVWPTMVSVSGVATVGISHRNPEFFGGAKVTWNRSFCVRTNSKTACQGRTTQRFGVFFRLLTAIVLGRVTTSGTVKEPTGGIDREGWRWGGEDSTPQIGKAVESSAAPKAKLVKDSFIFMTGMVESCPPKANINNKGDKSWNHSCY